MEIITRSGESWDMISYRVYGEERRMHELIAANPQFCEVSLFPHGVALQGPDISASAGESLPPWKR